MGINSTQSRRQVSRKEFSDNWDKCFGKNKEEPVREGWTQLGDGISMPTRETLEKALKEQGVETERPGNY